MSRALAMALTTGALTAALALASGRPAHAETGELPNGATIQFLRFYISQNGTQVEQNDPTARRRYLNLAHCVCAQQGMGMDTTFQYEVKLTTSTGTRRPGEVWVGSQCDNDTQRPTTCRRIDSESIPDIDALATTARRIELSLFDVINGVNTDNDCDEREGDAFAWILVDSNGDNVIDYTQNQSVGVGTDVTGIDTQPPTLPDDITANAGENSILLSWKTSTTRAADIYGYQALCSLDGQPVTTSPPGAEYQTTASVCDLPQEFDMVPSSVADSDAGDAVEAQPAEFRSLNKAFLCGTESAGSATQLRIKGLENGKKYKVALLAYDRSGNVTGTYFDSTVAPRAVTDLWEDLHDRGSQVQGGCLGTSLPGDGGPMSGLLLALGVGTVVLWRRRKVVLVAGALAAAGGTAQADKFQPYWDEPIPDDGLLANVVDDVHWHAGIRVGPYTPNIDGQIGKNATTGLGPYAAMFGDSVTREGEEPRSHHVWQVLPMLDVDYVLLRGFGQVTIGGSVGYMQQSALAYAEGTTADMKTRLRQPGNEVTFRLLPLSLQAGYRLTYLDDRFGIPIIPYVRGGLAYYLWQLKAPNGEVSKDCRFETADCAKDQNANKAQGASFGLVGSIGFAVRAEDIDRDSARSMRETGLQHAGFYAELSLAKVDGFGSDEKLAVGDATWFAGIDFEF